ncbi:MAG: hypothetical protein NWS28_05670 [Limnohabitans sp.]|nr:hypothetical protein [Limnohabitans sp.]
MNFQIRVPLDTTAEQHARLCALRVVFAQVCNQLSPHVQQSRVWNRVALHHLHYHALRTQFPALGSQMVCNAIYAVSKMARLVYQHPKSPYNPALNPGAALPLLRFADSCPVYFDRHTLSLKPGQLSLFTMDGRMRFELTLGEDKLAVFDQAKLREIVLNERVDKVFELSFFLDSADAADPGEITLPTGQTAPSAPPARWIPEYVSVEVKS